MTNRPIDTAFNFLAVASILNLNGAVMMAIGIPQTGSAVMLLSCLVLIAQLGRARLPLPDIALIGSLLLYLILAALFAAMRGNPQATMQLFSAYLISMFMLWAISCYMAYTATVGRMPGILMLIRNLLVIGCVTILLSPILYPFFLFPPPSAESRLGGFYANPNEAGVVACAALAFILEIPFRRRSLQWACLAGVSLAALLTFSKTAWLILLLIYFLHLFRQGRRNFFVLGLLTGLIVMLTLTSITDILYWVIGNPYFELSLAQVRRIEDILFVLTNEDTAGSALTGRDQLWQAGFQLIKDSPFAGYGLGSFHHIPGVLFEGDDWQGVHNVYLMIWGESGLLPFVAFTLTSLLIAGYVLKRHMHPVALPLGLILLLNLQVNHNILTSRYFIVILGVLLGLLRTARPFSGISSR